MINSPEFIVEQLKDKSIEEIQKERKKLLRQIARYENGTYMKDYVKKDKNGNIIYTFVDPSPEVIYYWQNEELILITKLLMEKLHKEMNGND